MFSTKLVSVQPMAAPSMNPLFYLDFAYQTFMEPGFLYRVIDKPVSVDEPTKESVWLSIRMEEGMGVRMQRVVDGVLTEEYGDVKDVRFCLPVIVQRILFDEAILLLPSMRGSFLAEDLGL